MMWKLYLPVFLILAVTFYQDYKFRAVSWFIFPMLFGALTALVVYKTSLNNLIINFSINLGLLGMIFGIITVYFSLKFRKLVNITKELIGWGDILFLICLAALFSPMNFMLFFTISLFMITISSMVYKWMSRKQEFLIPLAGLQAVLLMLVIIAEITFPFVNLYNDDWLLYRLFL